MGVVCNYIQIMRIGLYVYLLYILTLRSYQAPCDLSCFFFAVGSLAPDVQPADHNASVTHNADSIYSHFPLSGYQGHKEDQISPVPSVSEH